MTQAPKHRVLRLVLGDQLNRLHSWFEKVEPNVFYLFCEMRQETDYTVHHIQKVVAFLLSMRRFRDELASAGHNCVYWALDDPDNPQELGAILRQQVVRLKIDRFEYQEPDEWRLDQQLKNIAQSIGIESACVSSEHFLGERGEVAKHFAGKKQWLMESFYRMMRKKHNILLQNGEPLGGKWNLDFENRKRLPKNHNPYVPKIYPRNVEGLVEMIHKSGAKTFGFIDPERFIWPSNRRQSQDMLAEFVLERLPLFGTFQDALSDTHWSLYHSRLSFALNTKMLNPLEVIRMVEGRHVAMPGEVSIAQAEGFIRQILGWREYVRGVYWAHMPAYAQHNFFGASRKLPGFYWTAETKMRCMARAIGQSLRWAYAHHIQRLMVTGNFAMLAEVEPAQVEQWYLGIYIDALEWVEMPNTLGMALFADGGIMASKPYAASANYLNKMGDHCGQCFYDPKKSTGTKACPFNSLYWNFIAKNTDKFSRNPRMAMPINTWANMDADKKTELLRQAESYLSDLENL